MPTINQLSATTSLTTSDKMVIYSNDNGDSRKATLSTLLDFLHDNFQEEGLVTQIVVPTTGQVVTLNAQTQDMWLVLNPAGALASLTVTLPPQSSAFDGQQVTVTTTQAITALTIGGNGATVYGSPGTLLAGGLVTFKFNVSQNGWYATNPSVSNTFSTIVVTQSINDVNNNEVVKIGSTASAVNEITILNAATNNSPRIQATGSNANIGIFLEPKGSGNVTVNSDIVVTESVAQDLFNKTLYSPTITSPSISAATMTGTTTTAAVSLGGNVTPTVGNTYNVGSSGARLDYVYARNANISDTVSALSLTASGTVTANVVAAASVNSTLLVGYDTTQDPPAGTVGALTQRNATVASATYKSSTGISTKRYNVSSIATGGGGTYFTVTLNDAVSTESAVVVTLLSSSAVSGSVVNVVGHVDWLSSTSFKVYFQQIDLVANSVNPVTASVDFSFAVIGSPATDRTL